MRAPDETASASAPGGVSLAQTSPAADERGFHVLANSTLNVAGLVLANGLGALSGLITARVLHAEGVGILAIAFGLAEFGRGLSNFTHNPSILEYHRGADRDRLFGTSLSLKLLGVALFVGVVALLAPWLATQLPVPAWAILLASVGLGLGVVSEIGTARFEAEGRYGLRNAILVLGPGVALLLTAALALVGQLTIATAIVASLVGTLSLSIGFAIAWRGPIRVRWDKPIARYLTTYGARLVGATFLASVLIWTDTLIIAHILGSRAAGLYTIAFNLTFLMVTASVAIGVALLPALSRLAGRGEDTSMGYQRGTLIALGLAAGLAVVYVVLGRFFLGFYGAEYVEAYPALVILTVFGLAGAMAVPAGAMLQVHDRAGTLTLVSLAQAVVNIPLNYALISRYGITGAAVATTTVFVAGTLALWIIVKRETGAWPLSRNVIREATAIARSKL